MASSPAAPASKDSSPPQHAERIPSSLLSSDDSSSDDSDSFLVDIIKRAKKAVRTKRKKKRQERRQKRRVPNRVVRHPNKEGIEKLRDDPTQSEFWRRLDNEAIKDPDSREGKEFRRDFRVSFGIFNYLYTEAQNATKTVTVGGEQHETLLWPPVDGLRNVNQPTHPLCLKILCALYMLGHGDVSRSLEGRSGMDEDTIRNFFKQFTEWMVKRFYREWIIPPDDHPEVMEVVLEFFEEADLPGAVGSTDVVHIPWDRCPAVWRVANKGKEGYPTRAYEVTVSHDCFIRAIAGSFMGSWNDKTIVRFDGFVQRVRQDATFCEKEFELHKQDENGNWVAYKVKGLYLVTDNGYHRWKCLMPPMLSWSEDDQQAWSEHVESKRKDVERTFGMLKIRFKILKVPMLYGSEVTVDNIFYTCAILHNMLLRWDGRERMEGDQEEEGYGHLSDDVIFKVEGGERHPRQAGQWAEGYKREQLHAGYDATRTGHEQMDCHFVEQPADTTEVEEDHDFSARRHALIEDYAWRRHRRQVLRRAV